jgi:hypothetical protein
MNREREWSEDRTGRKGTRVERGGNEAYRRGSPSALSQISISNGDLAVSVDRL